MAVLLSSLSLENFKSFRGQVDIPLAPKPGTLVCVVGPNGAGKSTLFDAISFCFGEKDDRAKNLAALVNEDALRNEEFVGRGVTASVSVDLKKEDGSVLKVSRSIVVTEVRSKEVATMPPPLPL